MLCLSAGLLTACMPNPVIGKWRRVEGNGYWVQPQGEHGEIQYNFGYGDLAISIYDRSGDDVSTFDTAYTYTENSLADGVVYNMEGDKLTIQYSDGTYEVLQKIHSD